MRKDDAEISDYDVADYLKTEIEVRYFLEEILNANDPKLLQMALGDVARSAGMAKIAKKAGLNRESLYKALKEEAHPRFETVMRVFNAMGMNVNIKVEQIGNDMDIELSGDEMGVLIGKRGQTLDSLQYLTSLVVNKESNEYIRVKVDTENYRKRRKDTLENLAKNLAYKVKRTKRPVTLEPMNPYERRVIHSTLQNDKYVSTHSEGDEPFRRVVITLNK